MMSSSSSLQFSFLAIQFSASFSRLFFLHNTNLLFPKKKPQKRNGIWEFSALSLSSPSHSDSHAANQWREEKEKRKRKEEEETSFKASGAILLISNSPIFAMKKDPQGTPT